METVAIRGPVRLICAGASTHVADLGVARVARRRERTVAVRLTGPRILRARKAVAAVFRRRIGCTIIAVKVAGLSIPVAAVEIARLAIAANGSAWALHRVCSAGCESATGWNSAYVILLHRSPQSGGLLAERYRPHDVVVRSKEALRTAIANGTGGSRASARREAGTGRNHGQVPRHHVRAVQLGAGCRDGTYVSRSEP